MKTHLLDNPVWYALTSGNSNFAQGNESAKYFPKDLSPFAAVAALNSEHFQSLYETLPFNEPVAIFTNDKSIFPAPWNIIGHIDGMQMLYAGKIKSKYDQDFIIPLDERHVPEMLDLAKLTNPGPFLPRTIEFGHYEGILQDNKLVAMTGQRLHSGGFVEISAVCTHPEYTGRGYARQLMLSQVWKIQAQEEVPYLHVRADNTRAIKIYEALGFTTRSQMSIFILKK